MTKRLITSVFLVLGLILILVLHDTLFFNTAIAALAFIGVYEIIKAFKFSNKQETILFIGFVPLMLFLFFTPHSILRIWILFVVFLTAMYFVFCVIFAFPNFDFAKIGGMFFFSGLLIVSFYSWVYLKYLFPYVSQGYATIYFIVLGIAFSWGSDTMAYLSGMLFGKHKMAPILSPKKTIEGAVGGVIGGVLIAEILTFIFATFFFEFGASTTVLYITIAVAGVFACLISIVGDLFASAVKRQMDIKDYGSIFPGHGGVLDRFDSQLFVMPLIAFVAKALVMFAPGLWN